MAWNCTISPKILDLVVEISCELVRSTQRGALRPEPKLRRTARAKSLHGTAAIEGNTLSIEQVDAVLDGRSVGAIHKREVLEVRNAAKVYDLAANLDGFSTKDFLRAHKIMMNDLVSPAGKFRTGQVGVWQDGKVRHMAPPAKRVPQLVEDLFKNLRSAKDLPLLVRAAIAHYEIEFIHPFSDGNGRMGRLWQHVILLQESPLFAYCPVESVIYDRQNDYYKALRASDRTGDTAAFVEFTLGALLVALKDTLSHVKPRRETSDDRLQLAQSSFGARSFSRKDYLKLHVGISTATGSRDLKRAVSEGALIMSGDKALARYQFKNTAISKV